MTKKATAAKSKTRAKKPHGRPTALVEGVAVQILTRMASGESLTSICRDEDMPAKSTVLLWAATDRNGFSDRYEKACEARAHHWADELLDIADDSTNDWMMHNDGENAGWKANGEAIQRARLRVDTRKWLLSKLLGRYADKQDLNHTSSDGSMTPKPSAVDPAAVAALVSKLTE